MASAAPHLPPRPSPLAWPDNAWSRIYGAYVLPALVGLVPPVAFVVPKALVILVMAAGVLALPVLFHRQGARQTWPRWLIWLTMMGGRDPALLSLMALGAAWALLATLWSPNTWGAIGLWARLGAISFCGMLALAAIDRLDPPRHRRVVDALTVGTVAGLAAAYMVWAYFYFPALRGTVALPYVYLHELNRGAAVFAVLLWPVLYVLWRRDRRLAALLLLVAAAYLIARLDSASAKTALAGAGLAFLLVAALPRTLPLLLAGIAAMSTLMLPWVFGLWLAPDAVIQSWPQLAPSAQHRLFIWQFGVERIAEHPWLGWGFDASRALPGGKTMPPVGIEVMPLHPHNSLLQVRLELGLAGAAILAGLIGRGLALAARASSSPAAGVHAAMLAAYLIVGLFGYGVWQSWWIAAGWLAWGIGQIALAPVTQADKG